MTTVPDPLYPLILDSITEGVFTVDADFRITTLNGAAQRIVGITQEDAVGRRCYEVLRGSVCQSRCPLKHTIETGDPQHDVRVTMLNSNMDPVPISVSTAVMKDPEGRLVGGVEVFRDISDIEALRRELSGRRSFGDIIGVSAPMQEIFRLVLDVAESDAPVLIQGASGTGKELIAKALHDQSPRADAPFIRVNCGALPDTLLESELFGYLRGAFTDARRDKPGRFQQADGGTLFLDEIGELSPAFQVKLLRVLQDGEVQPLGGTETRIVDVRVLSATHRDLPSMIGEGAFREDLFYRLCVIPIQIPPLRERRADIIPLIEHFVIRLAARTGKPIQGLSPAALHVLVDYGFPGNVRELINILERAFVLCHGEQIEIGHLPPGVTEPRPPGPPLLDPAQGSRKPSERVLRSASQIPDPTGGAGTPPHVQALIQELNEHGWNRRATAGALGISRSTLWRRMKEYGLIR